jgi:hypothetical protein
VKLFVGGFAFDPAILARTPVPCDVQSLKAGEPRFPVASWAAAGVRAWLLASSAECAGDVIHEVGAHAQGGIFGLTLEAAGLTEHAAAGARVVAAAAGIVPMAAAARDDPRLRAALAMAGRFGGRSSFWAALGHDAGVLSRRALSTMPLDTVTLEEDIAARRRQAREALAGARAPLWTTDAEGFGVEGRAMTRTIRVVDLK